MRKKIAFMKTFLANIKIQVHSDIFIKDPETTELGRNILQESIILIDELGFESFTFKKLGEKIGSNESSIYRYFDNKHKLLMYLTSWYWSWIECKLVLSTSNIQDPMEQLMKAITVVTERIEDDTTKTHINEFVLNKIIITEFTKTFLTKHVDNEIREGFFMVYNRVLNRIINMLGAIIPNYPYAKSFVSDMVEGSLHQYYLSSHMKTITNCNENVSPTDYYIDLTKRLLNSTL